MGEFALGQPVSRFEDPRLLRGGGRYVDDMVLPRMVSGHVLRSPHAHARIRSIDTTAAKAAPGVLAVLTGADWEASVGATCLRPRGTGGATAPPPIGRASRHWSRIASAGSATTSPLLSPRAAIRWPTPRS
jgi:CO/xanthine dehydrogenase Mo-binding subunit